MVNFKQWLESELPFAKAVSQGIEFVTGKPVTFSYIRGKIPALNFGTTYQQHIEPSGRYMIHNENPGDKHKDYEYGQVTFQNPLVIQLNSKYDPGSEIYNQHSWKFVLSNYYNGKIGKDLSHAIRADGYDAIVTVVGSNDVREIVDLTMF